VSDWLDHMLHTPIRQLAWWEFLIAVIIWFVPLATLFGINWWWSGRRYRKGNK
jgi:hypothetical protein